MADLSVEESGERVRLQQLADAGIEDRMLPPSDKPPVHSAVAPHDFVESEFPEGKGHCDICGGGPDAPIHHHVDPLERIAAALERLADPNPSSVTATSALHGVAFAAADLVALIASSNLHIRMVTALERIAAALDPEKLASYVDSIDGTLAQGVVALERIAAHLEQMRDEYQQQTPALERLTMAVEGIQKVGEAMLEMMVVEANPKARRE